MQTKSKRPVLPPTSRFGNPVAAVLGVTLIMLHNTGLLAKLGLTPELAFDLVTGLLSLAAVIFGGLDWKHGKTLGAELEAGAAALEDRELAPAERPPEEDTTPIELPREGEKADR